MQIIKMVLLTILVLGLLAACGGDRDIQVNVQVGDRATEEASSLPTTSEQQPTASAEPIAPPEVATTAPEQPAAPTAAPDPTTAPTAETETQPTTEPEPTSPPAPPTELPQEIAEAYYTLDPETWDATVTTLTSFRQKLVLRFTADSSGLQSTVFYEGEVTTNPIALHSTLRVEGEATAELPANTVELIWIGDQAWVKVGRRPWVQVPVTALETEYAGEVVGVGDLLPFIQQAQRVMPDETVNGILCKHYAYDVSNLQTESGMTTAQGDIWVAKDGGYVVRLTLDGHGTYYLTYETSGAISLVYDLFDVNAPITINPPR